MILLVIVAAVVFVIQIADLCALASFSSTPCIREGNFPRPPDDTYLPISEGGPRPEAEGSADLSSASESPTAYSRTAMGPTGTRDSLAISHGQRYKPPWAEW